MQCLINIHLKNINLLLFLKLLIILNIIIPSLSSSFQCEYNKPFLLQNGGCGDGINCPPYDIESGKCEISNETLKIQFFNNMIYLNNSNIDFNEFDIITTLNEKLIFIGNSNDIRYKDKRVFYILNKDGRGYFTNKTADEENFFFIFENFTSSKTYGNSFSFKLNNKDYIWTISPDNIIEIYDFDIHEKYEYNSSYMLESYSYTHHMSSFLENDNNYLLGLMGIFEGKTYFFIYRLNFTLNNNELLINTKYSKIMSNSKIVSCYKTVLKYIICFYQSALNSYVANVYNRTFDYVTYTDIYNEPIDENYFFKCAHFYEEVGIFGYFDSEDVFTFKFKLLQNKTFKNYYTHRETLSLNLELNKNIYMSDIIKLDDKKICFSSYFYNVLYIIILSDYNEGKIKIRYYEINMGNLYLYVFKGLLKMSLYNNFIALGASYRQTKSFENEEESSSSLLLLSYPNSKDFDIDIEDCFTTSEYIIIDLNSKCIIDNNIFGLIPNGVQIINFDETFRLLSTKDFRNINIGESIDTDEYIILAISNISHFSITGKIEYAMIITEPEYDIYNRYTKKSEYNGVGIDEENNGYFIRKNYTGKHSYCKFKLNINKLTNLCQDPYCKLCFISNFTNCIFCEYGYGDISCLKPNIPTTFFDIIKSETTIIKTSILETIYTTHIHSSIIENTIIETSLPENTIIKTLIPETTYIEKPSIFLELDKSNIYRTNIETKNIESTNIERTNIGTTNLEITNIKSYQIESNLIDKNTYETLNSKTTIILNDNDFITSIIINININNKLNCTNDEIMKNKCIIGKIDINQIDEIKTELLKNNNSSNFLIKSENITIQITTPEEQKNDIPEVSSIDLGECENLLKVHYNISKDESLIIFKIDIKTEDLSSTYVKYEVYDPKKERKLNLDICKDVPISISVPVILDKNIDSIYDSLVESGYNIFNENDSFYQDICSTYTTVNGTDMLLSDRKKDIFALSVNQSLCQVGCEFKSYNSTSKKAKCDCEMKTEEVEINSNVKIDELFDKKEIAESFYYTLANSNFEVLKCSKLIFSFLRIKKNIGEILMIIILILFIALGIISFSLFHKIITKYIKEIIENNFSKSSEIKANLNNNTIKPKKVKRKRKKKRKPKKIIKNKMNNPPKKKNSKTAKNELESQKSEGIRLNKNLFSKTSREKKYQKNKNNNQITDKNGIKIFNKSKRKKKISKSSKNKFYLKNSSSIKEINETKNIVKLNDKEINSLEYELAIIYDKRTYIQYYCSLIKLKHLIIFTFFSQNDYNIITVKIALFLLSFELYLTINGFFFSDDTMHKIYEDKGKFNILFQIPQFLYSSVISAIINMILKRLALSEDNILTIKKEKQYNNIIEKSKKVEMCIKLKLILFFIIGLIFILFFSFFISCFCAVYINTQIILIQNTLISFCLSMIYPFGINLLPCFFRLPALRAENKDKKCLYKFSNLLALV